MSADAQRPTLLFIDDEPDMGEIAQMCFESAGWNVVTACNIADAKRMTEANRVDVILSDVMMRGGSGLDLLDWVRARPGPRIAFYLLTGVVEEQAGASERGADGVFAKPCSWSDLVEALSHKTFSSQLNP